MTSDVVLTAALRDNLLSLKGTQSAIDQTQLRLATGLKVNSALDNPQSFFAASALNNRAGDLSRLLDGLGQSIQAIKAADSGVSALNGLLDQADAIAQSAQEAIAQGTAEAKLTGDEDLSGIKDLATLNNIDAGNTVTITVTDPTDPTTPSINAQPITLQAGDSIEEFITAINDLDDGLTEDVIEAKLDESGNLQIRTLNGGDLRIEFDAAGAGGGGTNAEDAAFAAALGYGNLATTEGDGAGNDVTGVTASGDSIIKSNALTLAVDGSIATASTSLQDLTGFANIDAATDQLTLTINGDTPSSAYSLYQDGTATDQTIQGLVDDINNDAAINGYIEASFNETTGQIEIRALDASVQSVSFETSAAAGSVTTNFGFGTGRADNVTTGPDTAAEIVHFGSGADELAALEEEYDGILTQIDELVSNGDTSYRGTNLLNGDDITTYFNEFRTSSITTEGVTYNSAGLGLSAADFSNQDTIDLRFEELRTAVESVRTFGTTLANDLNVIETRQEFTTNLINTLEEGADKLTLADQNEEGAKLLALQTRQQLGVTSLALASQSQQSILRLF